VSDLFAKLLVLMFLVSAEQRADGAIKQLLALNSEPLAQLLEQEREEEERLLAAADKYNKALRKDDILENMEDLLEQELIRFQQFHDSRVEASKNILEMETHYDYRVTEILQSQDLHKAELLEKLQEDGDLQKVAVGALLERGDARSWGLLQQVRLVESQLAALTFIEMDKRKLEIDHNLVSLCDSRGHATVKILSERLVREENRSVVPLDRSVGATEAKEGAVAVHSADSGRIQQQLGRFLVEAVPEAVRQVHFASFCRFVFNCVVQVTRGTVRGAEEHRPDARTGPLTQRSHQLSTVFSQDDAMSMQVV
jgi:hypothetical protein